MSIVRQWFASLHETLDDLILRYPEATGEERGRMQEQWNKLKSLSDETVESWLQFEDKLALFREIEQQGAIVQKPEILLGPFLKGQGYFKLHMFSQAAEQLEDTVRTYPDMLAARLYLAMSRMHLKEWDEAQRHFRLVAALTDESKLAAIAYNALGCIQAVFAHLDGGRSILRRPQQELGMLPQRRGRAAFAIRQRRAAGHGIKRSEGDGHQKGSFS
jgi:tetratricopeptide (TPR) repeat protein